MMSVIVTYTSVYYKAIIVKYFDNGAIQSLEVLCSLVSVCLKFLVVLHVRLANKCIKVLYVCL